MTRAQVIAELDKLTKAISDGKIDTRNAVELAFAIGCEVERLDTMHRACSEYDRARAAREAGFVRHMHGDFRK